MDFLLFSFFFGSILVLFMPVYALSYKVFEIKNKRSLYGKASQQLSYCIALLAILYFFAFGLDILMHGTFYQLNVLFAEKFPQSNVDTFFYGIIGIFFFLACISFLYAKKIKHIIFPFLSCCCGFVALYFLFVWFSFFASSADISTILGNAQFFPKYFLKIIFGFDYHFISAKNYDFIFQILLATIFYSFVFLFALYLIVIFTIIVRNKMDFGRDYYTFVLQKYGKTLFFITFILLLAIAVMTVLFEPSLEKNIAHIILPFVSEKVLYIQIGIAIFPFIYLPLSMKGKKSFYTATMPMQKKSIVFILFLFDLLFMFGYFSLLVYA